MIKLGLSIDDVEGDEEEDMPNLVEDKAQEDSTNKMEDVD